VCIVECTGHLLSDRDTTSSTGMGAGVNGNNQWEWEGNGNNTRLNLGLGLGLGIGINHWEWEGMGLKKILPLISVTRGQCITRPTATFPALERHRPLTATMLDCLVTETHWCK